MSLLWSGISRKYSLSTLVVGSGFGGSGGVTHHVWWLHFLRFCVEGRGVFGFPAHSLILMM